MCLVARCWEVQAPCQKDGEQPAHLEEGSLAALAVRSLALVRDTALSFQVDANRWVYSGTDSA